VNVLARALVAVGRLLSRGARIFNYLAAGTQRLSDLRAGVERSWEAFNARDVDVGSGLLPWESRIVDRVVKPGDRLLIVGSGTGRDLVALAERGYTVTGVEPSSHARAIAEHSLERRHLAATIVGGFFEDAAMTERFDVIMFSYYCYCYIPMAARRIDILHKAGAALEPGGRVIVSYFARDRGRVMLARVARWMAAVSGSDWRPEDGDGLYPLESRRGPLRFHYEHTFVPGEIDREATAAGLRVVHREDAPGDPILVLERAE